MRQKNLVKDRSISLIRVTSMFLIILTHIIAEIDSISFLSLVTNAAVHTFLFTSAYIFSKKEIDNYWKWLKRRLERILIPSYIFIFILFIYYALKDNVFYYSDLLVYVFNLQGILGTFQGGGHLWYLTTIMFCYFITPFLALYKSSFIKYSRNQQKFLLISMVIIWLVISLVSPTNIGKNIGYIVFYIVSYFLTIIIDRNLSWKKFSVFTLLTIVVILCRLILKFYIDGTNLYDVVVVNICQGILGVYLFLLIDKFSFILQNRILYKIIYHLDKISYEMYITHFTFIVGPLLIWGATKNIIIDSFLVILITYLSAIILNIISNVVFKVLNHI